jgi:hypothetical protein
LALVSRCGEPAVSLFFWLHPFTLMTLLRTTAVLALLLLAACDLSDPPVATRLVADTPVVLTGQAGDTVAVTPGVVLTDQRGRGLANVLVTWQEGVNSGLAGVDTVRTDSRGFASATRWTLGIGVGQQTLAASVSGLQPVVFTATVSPGAPAVMQRRSAEVQAALVDTRVPEAPAVQVFDQFGNPVPGVAVTFAVLQGGGLVLGNPVMLTNGSGEATLDGWQLGTSTAVEHRLTATVPTVPGGIVFRATARPDVPVRIEPASALQQDGVPSLAVASRPAVRTRDRFGNPAGGTPVTFTPRTGSGTVSGSVRTTDTVDGIARVGGWVLSDASQQELVARSPDFPADSFVFRVNAVPSLFFIETVFINGEPSPRNLQSVERAVQRWRRVIAGQLPPALVIANEEACGPGVPAINEAITNVRIYINFDSIDGPGAVLGRAGPCFIRTASGLPVVGFVELDTADLSNLERNGTLDDVMTHEFGHVLGLQSFNWARRGLVVNQGGLDPYFQGAVGREGFAAIGGGTYTGTPVPLENTGGQGTRDSHWRLNVLRRELMVGFAQQGGMPLSQLSVGALADLGYQVRLQDAEAFTMPPFGTAAFGALMMPSTAVAYGDDHWPGAVWAVDAVGRQRLVRDGDWRVTRRQVTRPGGR